MANEYSSYSEDGKDESGKKNKNGDGSDSDDLHFPVRRNLKQKAVKVKDALFRVKWWRIVLGRCILSSYVLQLDLSCPDEAHNIKNKTTKSAIACCALEGKNRWCLTGTPMQNNVDELYSLINFLRIKPLNDWQTFRAQISEPVKKGHPQRAIKRLHVSAFVLNHSRYLTRLER